LTIFRGIKTHLTSWASAAYSAFDVRDVFVFGGIGMMGYGLWMFIPWVAYTITGATLMLLGLGWLVRRPIK
jgi:hypothetical protein